MNCRHCQTKLKHDFVDLGYAPPSNSYVTKEELYKPQKTFPLKIKVCNQCWLVQTEDHLEADEFFGDDYAYFSSTSESFLQHAKDYVENITQALKLNSESFVIEIASNDGYLLKNFLNKKIHCLGIEPTLSTSDAAKKLGIEVIQQFFGQNLAENLKGKNKLADLIIGNNVYAHVPDINDFTQGLKTALKPNGTINLEFPHLMQLLKNSQFDTIYHEHFSYLSLITVNKIFKTFGLKIFNVEEIATHGGSLRIYGCHLHDKRKTSIKVNRLIEKEKKFGITSLKTYADFQKVADRIRKEFTEFLIKQKNEKKNIAAYGAAAKGSTLLNYCGIKEDLLPFVCDAAVSKQGKFLPGSLIPIVSPSAITRDELDYLVIFPWNLLSEIKKQLSSVVGKKTKFVTAIPKLRKNA